MSARISIPAEPHDWPVTGPASPSEVALVVIDLQHDFVSDEGWFARTIGRDVSNVRVAVPVVASLLAAARRVPRLRVVHTRQGNAADLSDLPDAKRAQGRVAGVPIGDPGPLGRGLVRGERGWEIVPEVAPADGERIVDKPGFGAFTGTDLDPWLRRQGVRALVLTGATANVCVLSTLYQAVDLGYDCLTVPDAIAGIDPATTETVCDLIRYQGGLFGSLAPADVVRRAMETVERAD